MFSCNDESRIDGVLIQHTLYENLSFREREALEKLIDEILSGNNGALSKLINFPCGGGAGCYDLGFIVTQIVYKMGEVQFIEESNKLTKEDAKQLEFLISAGLEYGDNDHNKEADNKIFSNEFPQLYKILAEKISN